MVLKISIRKEGKSASLVDDSIEANIVALRDWFSNKNAEDLIIKVVDVDLVYINTLTPYEYENESLPLRLLLNDINNEGSFLFIKLMSLFPSEDVIEMKINMLKYMIKCYIGCCFSTTEKTNNEEYDLYYSEYFHPYGFKYSLPKELIKQIKFNKVSTWIDLSLLSIEDLACYVIPYYYREIGWFDRENIRNNKELMTFLATGWFENAKHGSLD